MSGLLDVQDLKVTLTTRQRSVEVVAGVDFHVGAGEIVGIVGESGSGKSVSALSLVGLQAPPLHATGVAQFGDTELLSAREAALRAVRGRDIGLIFQDSLAGLHPMLTIERQITEPLFTHMDIKYDQARSRARELLEQVRIPDAERALKRYPHEFSGGMRQRIAIAAALACGPRLLIADEPTTALDVTVQAGILRLLVELRRETGLAVLMITHDLGVLSAIADRLYVFYGGRVVESGPMVEVIRRPRHPYTKALLDAVPRGGKETLKAIPGAPAQPGGWPVGCVFAPRCAYARDTCRAAEPALALVEPERALRCAVDPFAARKA